VRPNRAEPAGKKSAAAAAKSRRHYSIDEIVSLSQRPEHLETLAGTIKKGGRVLPAARKGQVVRVPGRVR
jgi:hypothetical protein